MVRTDVLITGAGGFVGRHLLHALRPAFPEARIVASGLIPSEGVVAIDLDIVDADAVMAAIAELRPRALFNLAAQSSVGTSIGAGHQTWATNLGGAMNLGTALARYAPDALFFQISSAEIYGAAFNDGPVGERTCPNPTSPYGRSKLAAEWLLGDVLGPSNRLLIVRPGNHSGPGQRTDFVIPSFAAQIAAIEQGLQPPRLAVGNLEVRRDFTDVRDVVSAYVKLFQKSFQLPMRWTVNVASGTSVTIRSVLDRLLADSSVQIEVVIDPARQRAADVPRAEIDVTLMREQINWRPRYGLDQMVHCVLDEARQRSH